MYASAGAEGVPVALVGSCATGLPSVCSSGRCKDTSASVLAGNVVKSSGASSAWLIEQAKHSGTISLSNGVCLTNPSNLGTCGVREK